MFKAMVTELSQGLWVYSVTQVDSVKSATIGHHRVPSVAID
jgi:hypothetical protein